MSKKSLKVNEPKEHWKAVVAARSRESARYLPESRPDPLLLDSADRLNSPEQQRDEVLPDFTQPYRDLLPNSILELANQSGYAAVFLQENLEVVYNVSTFLYRTEFPGKLPFRPFRGGELFCDPERRKDALKLVFPTPKPTKKMFKYGKMVGEGGFGVVMCARAKVIPKGAGTTSPSGKKVKVKEVAVKKLIHSTSKQQKQNFDELGFLATLAHPNIVNFYYALHVKENTDESGAIVEELWLVTEFLLGGTLDQASTYKAWPQNSVAFVAWQILSALEYLHSQNIAHRDLKSTNVMMSVKGEIKLIDFGLCCDFQSGPRTQILGTSHWIPPEMIKGVPHSLPVDIWSLGVWYGKKNEKKEQKQKSKEGKKTKRRKKEKKRQRIQKKKEKTKKRKR